MALTTLYNSTNHPLTWDKVNETLKVVDDNFTFVSSQATTGVLQNLSQDITPNAVGTFDLGTPTQRWDNIYANSVDVGSIRADITGSIFAQDSSVIVDATDGTLTGNLTGDVTGSVFADDSTLMVDAINNRLFAESFDGIAVRASIIDSPTGSGLLQIKAGDVSDSGNVIFINPYGSNTFINSKAETHTWGTGPYSGTGNPYIDFKTAGAFEAHDGAYFVGNLTGNVQGNVTGNLTGNVLGNVVGDVVGSVYSDDSSGVLVDGLHGVLNTSKLDRIGAQDGEALVWSDSNGQWEPGVVSGGGGAGTGLGTRTTKAASTSSIADDAIGNTIVQGAFSAYMLLKIQVDAAAWVRIYTDQASRTADASRGETTDPSPGAGVVAEIITTGADTILISPAVMGFNNENPVTTDIPIAVKNKSGSTTAITVTLTLIQMEA